MKINFEVNNVKYTVELDSNNYTLFRHGSNSDKNSPNYGSPTEIALGYFSKLPNAITKAIQDSFATIEESIDLKDFVKRLENIRNDIEKMIGDI